MTMNGAAMTSESVPVTRLESLQSKHSELSQKIERELQSPSAADFYIHQLKKQKLLLKDEIEKMKQSVAN